ncbi:MAG: hypothetical protein HXX80_00310 [Nitrososphaerales archaeon]|nr:hypothetical protein [Nitrososphaerales archaeon]
MVKFKKDNRLFALFFILVISTLWVYLNFFNVILNHFDYRSLVGYLFLIPITLLTLGQVFCGSILIHLITKLADPNKVDYLKALVISSAITFLFSVTYLIFPYTGPFYYVTFLIYPSSGYLLFVEILWTALIISTGTYLLRKAYTMRWKYSIGTVSFILLITMVAAS